MKQPTEGLGLRTLAGNIAFTMLTQILLLGVNVGLAAMRGRWLGAEEFGILALALLLPKMLGSGLSLGLPRANIYYVARGEVSIAQALRVNLATWLIVCALGTLICAALIAGPGEALLPGVSCRLLWMTLPFFFASVLCALLVSLLQAVEDFRRCNLAQFCNALSVLVFTAIAFFGLGTGVGGTLVAQGIGGFVGAGVALYGVQHHIRRQHGQPPMAGFLRASLGYGWKSALTGWAAFLNRRADLYLVAWFLSGASMGIYALALTIGELLTMLAQTIGITALPRLAGLHCRPEALRQLTPLVSRFVLLATLAEIILLILFGRPVLTLVFGNEFTPAFEVVLWLLPSFLVANTVQIIGHDLAARGRPGLNLVRWTIHLPIKILLAVILIPRFGLTGAACAGSTSAVLVGALTLAIYARISGNRWWRPLLLERSDWELLRRATAGMAGRARPGKNPGPATIGTPHYQPSKDRQQDDAATTAVAPTPPPTTAPYVGQ